GRVEVVSLAEGATQPATRLPVTSGEGQIIDVKIGPDDAYLLDAVRCSCNDYYVDLWRRDNSERTRLYEGPSAITDLAFAGPTTVVAIDRENEHNLSGRLRMWDVVSRTEMATQTTVEAERIIGSPSGVLAVKTAQGIETFRVDGNQLVSAGPLPIAIDAL